MKPPTISGEAERIRAEYEHRERSIPSDRYSLAALPNLFWYQQRGRRLLQLLHEEQLLPLGGKRILDVGCGDGRHLLELEGWGARRGDLAGIDLMPSRVDRAAARLGHSGGSERCELRVGDASQLPWPDQTFDVVCQNTVFTSVLDIAMRRAIAGEVLRVLRPGGACLWYDFLFNNPANPNVRGISAREIRELFYPCSVRTQRITLAPPIARRLVPISWVGCVLLESLVLFNTHYLAIIRKPS